MLREVDIDTPGHLYLHSMPGRYEPLGPFYHNLKGKEISVIVCLAPDQEIQEKSPAYHDSIQNHAVPVPRLVFPVPDYSDPEDIEGFYEFARGIALRLKQGEHVLIHCAGGVGRTGMLAQCVLKSLGLDIQAVCQAKSAPETKAQRDVVKGTPSDK